MSSVLVAKSNNDNEWYVDSGATKHMTHIDLEMENIKKPSIKQVKAANGERMDIERTGDIKCKISNDSIFILSDVQYIPKLCVNLLSVSQMVKNGCSVLFNADGCKIFSKDKKLLAEGKMANGMFTIKIHFTESACAAGIIKNDDIALWHRRLAHLNFSTLKTMLKLKVEPDTKCTVCVKGKHSRAPFNEPGTRANKQLELVHTDVCGPMLVKSLGGARYFVSFIDDFSRKVHIYILKTKAEGFNKFVLYKKMVENELDLKIKSVRSDNGTEFVNKNFSEFFAKHGIKHEKSTPYSPQQNGLAERMNRTIIEKARCMLIDSKLAKTFWAEAVQAAVNVINAITCSSTNASPEERWNGTKCNFADFKVFGCRAMAWQPNVKRNNISSTISKYIFLRKADDAKAYRLYDANKQKIIISRDVVFLEKENRVIDANNFNNNSHVYIRDDERFEEIIKNDQVSTGDHAPIDSGESDNVNESTSADENADNENNVLNADDERNVSNDVLTGDENPENDSNDVTFESINESLNDTTIDDGARQSISGDPNFTTRARVDTNADRAVTRSMRDLWNFHIAFSVFQEPDSYQEEP